MSAMIAADVIEPWDNYIPKDVLDDIIPSIREENTIDGKIYGWPFLLDVIGTRLAFGPDHQGRPARRGSRDLGRATSPTPRRSSIPAPRPSAPRSIRMAGARSRRSPTA